MSAKPYQQDATVRLGVSESWGLLDALNLPLFPWHAAPKPRIVRIEPDQIIGRRFHVLDTPARHMPKRASPE